MEPNNLPKPANDSSSKIWWEGEILESKAMGLKQNTPTRSKQSSKFKRLKEWVYCEEISPDCPGTYSLRGGGRVYQLACRYVIHGGDTWRGHPCYCLDIVGLRQKTAPWTVMGGQSVFHWYLKLIIEMGDVSHMDCGLFQIHSAGISGVSGYRARTLLGRILWVKLGS